MSKIAEISYVIESSEDEETLWVTDTNQQIEILDVVEFPYNDKRVITFYLLDKTNNKLGGITLSDEQMDNLNREHLRDAFILALN
jgi:hypothetical protein